MSKSPTPRREAWQVDASLIVDPVFHDGRLREWALLPDTTWRDLAPILSDRYDRIGFSRNNHLADTAAFADGAIARALELDGCEFLPEVEAGAESYDLYVCEFTAYTAYLLGQTRFNHWHASDGEFSDEVCFLKDGRVEMMAQPWRSMLHFFAVDNALLQRVENANARFKGSVFVIENGQFRGI